MIVIDKNGIKGDELNNLGYIKGRFGIGRIVLPITRFLRTINAESYINDGERLLDIGCGDGYFIKRLKIKERYGLDKLLGDEVKDKLNFPDSFFDYVTMLAVIEHIDEPAVLFKEIHRVLKPNGKFVFTTPKKQAELLFRLYAKNIDEEHESYFDHDKVKELARDMFTIVDYKTFILGLNQVYSLQKT
ncbi:MAG: class I SAM-dependent methyltransferase [Deltaproteobacteria bacterium]|nr:MAG: class I SAM-dependent methyltransferase [Deltaproteobacteria bacterium]